MHADQATEPCVDLALRNGVPFAVLPCCVMPTLFPLRRQRRNGQPVRSYRSAPVSLSLSLLHAKVILLVGTWIGAALKKDKLTCLPRCCAVVCPPPLPHLALVRHSAFCDFLLDKAPEGEAFASAALPFVGKNRVIFRLPATVPAASVPAASVPAASVPEALVLAAKMQPVPPALRASDYKR